MANSLESCDQSSCQVVFRVVVKGLLSEGFCQSGRCQRAAVRGLLSEGICQRAAVRGHLSEGICQSGRCQRAAVRGLLSEWQLSESKSATELLHSPVLVIYTAQNLPKSQYHQIIQMRAKTQQSKLRSPNPDPKKAILETQTNRETQEPTQKDKQRRPNSAK